VFLFIANSKGSSWAYASPGLQGATAPEVLADLRRLAGAGEAKGRAAHYTEVRRAAGTTLGCCCVAVLSNRTLAPRRHAS
jgi:hypothetical protein